MLVVCDTNVLISVALGRRKTMLELRQAWQDFRFQLALNQILLDEFSEVVKRPHLNDKFEAGFIQSLIQEFLDYGEYINVEPPYPAFDDPDDAFLLAMLEAGVEVLVTGDGDLLKLKTYAGKVILTVSEFLETLNQQEQS